MFYSICCTVFVINMLQNIILQNNFTNESSTYCNEQLLNMMNSQLTISHWIVIEYGRYHGIITYDKKNNINEFLLSGFGSKFESKNA